MFSASLVRRSLHCTLWGRSNKNWHDLFGRLGKEKLVLAALTIRVNRGYEWRSRVHPKKAVYW